MTETTKQTSINSERRGLNAELSEVRPQSTRISQAFAYAHWLHHKQVRKSNPTTPQPNDGTSNTAPVTTGDEQQEIPYLTHLVDVFSLLIQAHASEDQLIAGLLHDAFEDQPVAPDQSNTIATITQEFGTDVVELIWAATDGDDSIVRNADTWLYRKAKYLDEQSKHALVKPHWLLVPLADKIANATSISIDLHLYGEQVWDRFSARRPQVLWYYRRNLENFTVAFGAQHVLVQRLAKLVSDLSDNLPAESAWEPTEAEIERSREIALA